MQVISRSSEWSASCSVRGRDPPPGAAQSPIVSDVVDDDPAGVGDPGRLDHQRPGLVAAADRDDDAARAELEVAGAAVEQGPECARRVEPRQAQPLDRAVVGDEGARVAVGEESVAADRREAVVDGAHCLAQATNGHGHRRRNPRRYAESVIVAVRSRRRGLRPDRGDPDNRRRDPLLAPSDGPPLGRQAGPDLAPDLLRVRPSRDRDRALQPDRPHLRGARHRPHGRAPADRRHRHPAARPRPDPLAAAADPRDPRSSTASRSSPTRRSPFRSGPPTSSSGTSPRSTRTPTERLRSTPSSTRPSSSSAA